MVLALLAGCDGQQGSMVLHPVGGAAGGSVSAGGAVSPGGSGGIQAAAGDNVLDVVVDSGPQNIGYINGLFATATICEPGTNNCQTIDHLLVDTGSVGVRVLESLVTLSLPEAKNDSGQALAECAPFVDGTAWGPLKTADFQLAGEKAAGLTIHLIGEQSYAVPTGCTGTPINDLSTLAANGILGVGLSLKDCGAACAMSAQSFLNPGTYYACSSPRGGCAVAAVPTNQQLSHPVASFPVDNNGVIIRLPSIAASGAASVPGQMVFGIGTATNNRLGSAVVVALDVNQFASTTFPVGGTSYASIIDSGSNGLYFLDGATTNLPQCTGGLRGLYCPSATTSLSATLAAASGGNPRVDFSVANPARLSATACAFSDIAGPMPGYRTDLGIPAFDWGLPFFFGRDVYIAIEGQGTSAGDGPYIAF